MLKIEKYNGWSNYGTWAVNLWLTNDEGDYLLIMDEVKRIKENPEYIEITPKEKILRTPEARLSDFLENGIEENNPLGSDANLYSDILRNALAHINYSEIAKHFIEE